MKIELMRFKVKSGKSAVVDQWMQVLNERLAECLATFEREQMYLEMIFREKIGDADFLYWFSMQGEAGLAVQTSEHAIDKVHLKFWDECIDRDYKPVDCALQVAMIPSYLAALMKPQTNPETENSSDEGI